MLNTKILLIIDIYFFSNFYLENNLNAIFQNIFVKLTSISIWIILACRFRFTAAIIIYISFKIFSIIFLLRSLSLMEDLIYVRFNKKIGVDAKMIYKYLLIEMIVTLKYISLIFEYTTMLVSLSLEKGISQKPFYSKINIISNRYIYKKAKYLLITTLFFSLAFIYGMIVIGDYFKQKTAQYNTVFVFNRIFNLLIIIVSIYTLCKINKH